MYFAEKCTKHSERETTRIFILFFIKQDIKKIFLTIKYSVSIGHYNIKGIVS